MQVGGHKTTPHRRYDVATNLMQKTQYKMYCHAIILDTTGTPYTFYEDVIMSTGSHTNYQYSRLVLYVTCARPLALLRTHDLATFDVENRRAVGMLNPMRDKNGSTSLGEEKG